MKVKPNINQSEGTSKPPLPQPSAPATSGLSVEILQQPVPKLPHEADQSTRDQETEIRPEMLQAEPDVGAGMQDTDRSPVVNEVYRGQKSQSKPA